MIGMIYCRKVHQVRDNICPDFFSQSTTKLPPPGVSCASPPSLFCSLSRSPCRPFLSFGQVGGVTAAEAAWGRLPVLFLFWGGGVVVWRFVAVGQGIPLLLSVEIAGGRFSRWCRSSCQEPYRTRKKKTSYQVRNVAWNGMRGVWPYVHSF